MENAEPPPECLFIRMSVTLSKNLQGHQVMLPFPDNKIMDPSPFTLIVYHTNASVAFLTFCYTWFTHDIYILLDWKPPENQVVSNSNLYYRLAYYKASVNILNKQRNGFVLATR